MNKEDCSTQNGSTPSKEKDVPIGNGTLMEKKENNFNKCAVAKKEDSRVTKTGAKSYLDIFRVLEDNYDGDDDDDDTFIVPKSKIDMVPEKRFNFETFKELENHEDDIAPTCNDALSISIVPYIEAASKKRYFFDIFKELDDDDDDGDDDDGDDDDDSDDDGNDDDDDDDDDDNDDDADDTGRKNVTQNGAVLKELQRKDENIATYDGIMIKQSDLESLKTPNYLSDNIIGFYFSYLSSRFQSADIFLVSPSLSYLLATLSPSDETYKALVKPLKLREKQLLIFTVNDGAEVHWSLLVYHRGTNTFIHHDSIKGQHQIYATDFYKTIKGFVGRPISRSSLSISSSSRPRMEMRRRKKLKKKYTGRAMRFYETKCLARYVDPLFKDGSFTPQQNNAYDCGLYVMEIARVICEWYLNGPRNRDELWFSDLEKIDTASIESGMRAQVLRLIEDVRNGTLRAPPPQ